MNSLPVALKVDNPLVVPVDNASRIITTANDVIHAWMVPYGVKQIQLRARHLDSAPRRPVISGQCASVLRQGARLCRSM
jgi:cytochrome c oxidase subunit 2